MTTKERNEFKQRVRAYMESGLNDNLFGDLALMYAALSDPTLDGESMQRLKPYETSGVPGQGWALIHAETTVRQ